MTWFHVGWRAQQSAIIDVKCKTYESSKSWTQMASFWKELKKKREGIKKEIQWDKCTPN
jgi:hypothetical protein